MKQNCGNNFPAICLYETYGHRINWWPHIYSDDIMFYHFTVTVSAAYTPFCAYTHIVQVPLPTAWRSPSGVTVATAVLLLS